MALKLHYFPVRGRGELARLLLHYAKKDFVDDRITPADWPNQKPKAPFGNLPYLEVGNEAFGQSMAIASYLAREAGLYGANNMDALKIEQIMHLREDLLTAEVRAWKEKDAAKAAEYNKDLTDNVYPHCLGAFEKLIKENQAKNQGSKYAVGKQLTMADIVVFEGTVTLSMKNQALLDKYPLTKAVAGLVPGLDGIKQYLAKRAKTDL